MIKQVLINDPLLLIEVASQLKRNIDLVVLVLNLA